MGPDNEDTWPYIWVKCHEMAKETYKGFDIRLWRNSEIYPTVDKEFPEYSQLVRDLPSITKFDFFRNILMALHGGIYFDLDFLMYENIYDALHKDKPTIIEGMFALERPDELVQNNFLASPTNQKIWMNVLKDCKENFYNTNWKTVPPYEKIMRITSSTFFTNFIKKYPNSFYVLPRNPYNLTKDEARKIDFKIPCNHLGTLCWMN
jgi:mannosyltransferase OCH1-like enzyme